MAKKKLIRFRENKNFSCLFEPNALEVLKEDFHLKGRWQSGYFKNTNPITLELGCGRGEYTIEQARIFPGRNFIGADIKGSRLFFGARTVLENNITNACFVRTQIELINRIIDREISEIWVTFPDPLPDRKHQRLTAPRYLNSYRDLLCDNGTVCLKTDNFDLFDFTRTIARENNLEILAETDNLYGSPLVESMPLIQTTYEKRFLAEGKNICFIRFKLNNPVKPLKKAKPPVSASDKSD